jgi:hypothetical protein
MENVNLYKFYWNCGRMGDVEGLFCATESEVNNAIGKKLYFGEILGKHSEIFGELKAEDITLLSSDQEFTHKFQEVTKGISLGYNPLAYIED